jgi:HK97 family phage major capsid protein
MSDGALKSARLITISGTDTRPLWQPGMIVGEPSTILDKPYFVDNGFAAVASAAKPIVFGAWANYWIRDVQGVQLMRLDERYAEYLQVGFLAFARNDARLIDAGQGPLKYLLMA